MGLIDKDTLAAEINRCIDDETETIKKYTHKKYIHPFYATEIKRCNARIVLLKKLQYFLNTLETKEVDLKEERIKDCPYRVVGCEKLGTITECNGACAWVVDCLKLKELKTKKGE